VTRAAAISYILLAVWTARVGAQELASVVVRVEADGVVLASATVETGTTVRTTGDDGTAALRIAPGVHALRVSRLGYVDQELRIVIRTDTTIVVVLEAEALEDEAIIVVSTRGERRIEDEPVRVEVLVAEEIEEKLLMTPGSIVMLLNETTGLRVQETSPSLGGANIRIQGLRGRYTQLLADGLPLYGGQAGALGLLQIPPMDLRQVEVIKGAASALYGSSALGGVVNLISKRPANERELLLNATTRGGTDAMLWLAGEGERWGYTLLAGLHGQSRSDVDGDAWFDIPMHRRAALRPRLFWNGARGRAMMTAGVMLEDRRGGGVLPDGTAFAQELETARVDAGTTGQLLLNEVLLLDYRASIVGTIHDHRFDTRRERDRHTTMFSEASLRGMNGAHRWAAGIAVQRDGYHARDVSGFDYAYWTPGLFAQDELSIGDQVTIAASGRLDRHSRYGTFLSPRTSVLVRPSGAVSLRVSAGTGFYAPTPFTEETEEVGLGNVEPLSQLVAERARSTAVDLGLGLGGVEANLTLFASWIEDAITVLPSPDGTVARLVNVDGTTRTRGTELLFRYRREPWGITASSTWLDAKEPTAHGGTRPVPLTPRSIAGLVAVYEQHDEGRAGIELYYTGRQDLEDNPYRSTSEPYVIVGILMEKRIGRVRAFLNLENLTDRRQTRYDPVVLPSPGAWGRQTTDSWAPLEGRLFNGGVRLAF
jgi:iron complex outermembrane receptor protein